MLLLRTIISRIVRFDSDLWLNTIQPETIAFGHKQVSKWTIQNKVMPSISIL